MRGSSRCFTSDFNYISDDADFYDIKPFDHDLILFADAGRGYRFNFNSLGIIGGRSAKSFKSAKLGSALKLCDEDTRFLTDFLFDGSRKYAFLVSDGKPLMFFNSLFRSSGLGVAIVFDYPSSVLASAMKNDDLEAFGERIYSSALLKMALTDIAPSLDHSGFIHSVSRVTRMISGALGDVNGTVDTVSCITAVESLIGCSIKYDKDEMVDAHLTDVHSTVSILLCLLSICRRLSVDRDAVMRIDSSHEHAKYTITFSSVSDTLGELDCECIDFCKELATRIEMPLSVELGGKSFGAEFVPYRVDPSLYGLKAGVNIKFNCED